jgi:hypothetical protein
MTDKLATVPSIAEAQLLSTPELARLVCSRHLKTLYQPLLDARKPEYLAAVSKVLYHVVRGEHEAVRALLTNNIDLLYGRSSVTDCSGREFKSISPFEYALWALDKHMWDTMLSCIPKNEKGNEVLAQLRLKYKALKIDEKAPEEKVETPKIKGVTYSLNGTLITESHFNFNQTIIKELQAQANAQDAPGDKNWQAINKQWVEGVGGAQRLLPMHVVNEYCALRAFYPIPNFTIYSGSSRQFYNDMTDANENWFTRDSKLGIDFGIIKGAVGRRCLAGRAAGWTHVEDLAAMTALCEVRTNDFINLETQLEQNMMADNQPLTVHM